MRIIALDGVRGTAAFAMPVPHFFMLTQPVSPSMEHVSTLAVEVFFLLSGFVLAPQILYCIRSKAVTDLKVFFVRRWMRTLPPYFCTPFFIAAVTVSIDPNTEFFPPERLISQGIDLHKPGAREVMEMVAAWARSFAAVACVPHSQHLPERLLNSGSFWSITNEPVRP